MSKLVGVRVGELIGFLCSADGLWRVGRVAGGLVSYALWAGCWIVCSLCFAGPVPACTRLCGRLLGGIKRMGVGGARAAPVVSQRPKGRHPDLRPHCGVGNLPVLPVKKTVLNTILTPQ